MKLRILTFLLMMTFTLSAQEPAIETVKLSDNFYVLYGGNGQGSNVGVLIEEEGILLVDAMVEESSEKLMNAIRQLSDKPIRYVFNTHGDFDHSGGNSFFAAQGATIIAHENTVFDGGTFNATFEKQISLKFGAETIHAWHSPSHSHTDISIYLEKHNALFLGDTFSNTWHPTFYATGMDAQYQVIEQALLRINPETKIVPGHGFVAGPEELSDYLTGCRQWISQMQKLVEANKSLEEMIADEELIRLRRQFTARKANGDMPDMNFQRLIQRTISSEFIELQPLKEPELTEFIGTYQGEDSQSIKVFMKSEKLFAGTEGQFLVELLPVSADRFHLRAWIDHHYAFEKDGQGKVIALIHQNSNGEKRYTAFIH